MAATGAGERSFLMESSGAMLRAAEDVMELLHQHDIDAVIIGAVALAAYHYVRLTEDIDLGVNASLKQQLQGLDPLIREAEQEKG